MNKPRLSFWQIWNMSFGFLGIQFGWGLQMANMSPIYQYLGADESKLPLLWLVPGAAFAGGLLALLLAWARKPVLAFVGSAVAELGVIGTAGVAMFPFIMPSSSDPRSSLTVWDSVSSHLTLSVMFWAALIFTPIVIAYTGWAYRMMAGKVTTAFIESHDRSAY